jgi:hypothetical protein
LAQIIVVWNALLGNPQAGGSAAVGFDSSGPVARNTP